MEPSALGKIDRKKLSFSPKLGNMSTLFFKSAIEIFFYHFVKKNQKNQKFLGIFCSVYDLYQNKKL